MQYHPTNTSPDSVITWSEVWPDAADRLAASPLHPKFYTESTIREAVIGALYDQQGFVEDHSDIEYPAANLGNGYGRGQVDLVAQDNAAFTTIEFKYPRPPRTTVPPISQQIGDVLADTYRLGAIASDNDTVQAFQVLAAAPSFIRSLTSICGACGIARPPYDGFAYPSSLTLTPETTASISTTARNKMRGYENLIATEATEVSEQEIAGKGLWLAVYAVHGARL